MASILANSEGILAFTFYFNVNLEKKTMEKADHSGLQGPV